jgi:hypothetical protein
VKVCCPLHGAVAACGLDKFLDAPTHLVIDPAADGHCGEHNREVGFDGIAFAVVDRSGL